MAVSRVVPEGGPKAIGGPDPDGLSPLMVQGKFRFMVTSGIGSQKKPEFHDLLKVVEGMRRKVCGSIVRLPSLNDCSCDSLFADVVTTVCFVKVDKFQWGESRSFEAWVITVARNLQHDCFRRRSGDDGVADGPPEVADPKSRNPFEETAAKEQSTAERKAFDECREELSSIEGTVLDLRLAGETIDQIAAAVGKTKPQVSIILFRAKMKMTVCVQRRLER